MGRTRPFYATTTVQNMIFLTLLTEEGTGASEAAIRAKLTKKRLAIFICARRTNHTAVALIRVNTPH